MYAAIRQGKAKTGMAEELARRIKEGAIPIISDVEGFMAYYVVYAPDDTGKADIAERHQDVRFVPKADQVRCSKKVGLLAAALDYASHQGFSKLDLSAARKRAASPPVTAR